MDLGRNYCQARRATCELCPLSDICLSFNQKIVSNIPSLSEKKKEQSYELNLLRLLIVDKDHIYMYQKSNKEWLSGQWEVPTYVLDCEDEKFKQYPEFNNQSFNATLLPSYKTLITKYKIKNYTMVASLSDVKSLGIDIAKYSLMPLDIKKQNFSTASIKAIKLLLS